MPSDGCCIRRSCPQVTLVLSANCRPPRGASWLCAGRGTVPGWARDVRQLTAVRPACGLRGQHLELERPARRGEVVLLQVPRGQPDTEQAGYPGRHRAPAHEHLRPAGLWIGLAPTSGAGQFRARDTHFFYLCTAFSCIGRNFGAIGNCLRLALSSWSQAASPRRRLRRLRRCRPCPPTGRPASARARWYSPAPRRRTRTRPRSCGTPRRLATGSLGRWS